MSKAAPKCKQGVTVTRTIQRWSDQSEYRLQDCFDHADREVIRAASQNNIDLYADSVSEFIRKCSADVVPTVTIKTYPNQKPLMDGGIRAKKRKPPHLTMER